MKKIVVAFLFFLGCAVIVVAQEADLRMGFQVSPTFSFMGTDNGDISGEGVNLGLKMGVRGEVYFRENYAFLVGLGFAFNSGGTLRYDRSVPGWPWRSQLPSGVLPSMPSGTDLKYSVQYVEIPVGIKLRTKEIGYLRYFVELPVITPAFRSQARGTIEYSGLREERIDIKEDVRALALSWGFGGGLEYSVGGNTALVAGLGFQRLFTDVSKDYTDDLSSKDHLSGIILQLGMMF
ncbi:MAG: hypothetical protein RLY31_357 [Bacteroidota bacterium]|jgi:hypothetical protein